MSFVEAGRGLGPSRLLSLLDQLRHAHGILHPTHWCWRMILLCECQAPM